MFLNAVEDSSNFYIEFGPKFQKYCGFEQFIWASTVAGALVTSRTDNYNTYSFIDGMAGTFTMLANTFMGNAQPLFFPGTKSVFSADTRISVDLCRYLILSPPNSLWKNRSFS